MKDGRTTSRGLLATGAVTVVVGIALRLYAALGDFWFDEIVSLNAALHATSAIDLLYVCSDNNHLLNSLLMHAIGEQAYWPMYRMPAVLAGGASIIVAGAIARRWGKPAAIATMVMFAVSHPLVHYGSEARGYSLAVMFMLLAVWLHMRLLTGTPSSPSSPGERRLALVAFWACVALGMLSHPLFLQAYLAMLGWSLWVISCDRSRTVPQRCVQLVSSHLVPIALAATLYFVHWRGMDVAGGAVEPPLRVVASSLALLVGFPHETPLACTIGAVISAAMIISAIACVLRKRDGFALFALLAMFVIPAAMLMLLRPDVLYERYFLLPMTVALLVISAWLGAGLDEVIGQRGWRRVASALLLAAIVATNLWHDRELILLGRGQYLAALEFIAANTPDDTIVIGSDHDARTTTLLGFYVRYLGGKNVRYVPAERWPGEDAQWFILQGRDRVAEPRHDIVDGFGLHWALEFRSDTADLSGWRWFVYRKVEPR